MSVTYSEYELFDVDFRIISIEQQLSACENNVSISLTVGLGFGQKFKSDPRVDVLPS
jgi:hypothetical protein